MIEKFNFFDVYVYLLPGMALLGLIWLPFGIVAGKWPPADWSSALLLLAAAYIVGHVLYYPAKVALPTKSSGRYGKREFQSPPAGSPPYGQRAQRATSDRVSGENKPDRRTELKQPSDYVLDADELSFTPEFKTELQKVIHDRFKGAADVDPVFDWDTQNEESRESETERRNLAFMLCRSALVTGKAGSYGEQFEGLYGFLRSLTLVFILACAYHLGWTLAVWNNYPGIGVLALWVAVIAVLLAAMATRLDPDDQQAAWFVIVMLAIALFACPFSVKGYLPSTNGAGPSKVPLLFGVFLLDALAFSRCRVAYTPFAQQFAVAFYRDFYANATGPKNGDNDS